MLAAGFGAGGGLWGVISNLAFIRFFGPNHLGEVSGFNASVTVFASAIGPAAFSLALDIFGAYHAAVYACIVVLIILLLPPCGSIRLSPRLLLAEPKGL